jgi:uncharacterized protein YjbJ (UPF0337 family)
MVDKNVVEGTIENITGKVEEGVGYVAGDPGARVEGKMRQMAGNVQSAYGRAAENLQEAAKHRPLPALLIAGTVGFVLGRISVAR